MAGRQERAGFRLHKTYCWGPSADLHTLAWRFLESKALNSKHPGASGATQEADCHASQAYLCHGPKHGLPTPLHLPVLLGPPQSPTLNPFPTYTAPDLNISTSSTTIPSCRVGAAPQTLVPHPTWVPSPAGRESPQPVRPRRCIPVGAISAWQGRAWRAWGHQPANGTGGVPCGQKAKSLLGGTGSAASRTGRDATLSPAQ